MFTFLKDNLLKSTQAMLNPQESGAFIAGTSEHSFVVKEGIFDAARKIYSQMKEQKYSFDMWKSCPVHPKVMNEDTVNWIFVVDCLNFSFWLPTEEQFELEFDGSKYYDYDALCNALNRAIKVCIYLVVFVFEINEIICLFIIHEIEWVFKSEYSIFFR